jgi:hypothetical protein
LGSSHVNDPRGSKTGNHDQGMRLPSRLQKRTFISTRHGSLAVASHAIFFSFASPVLSNPKSARLPLWPQFPLRVIRAILTAGQLLLVYPDQQTSSDRSGWSVKCPTADIHEKNEAAR